MKKVMLLAFALLILSVAACTTETGTQMEARQTQTQTQTQAETEGRAVFAITDAAANMGSVTSVMLTVDKVEVHSQENGWAEVSTSPGTFDLLKLKAESSQELLADVQLEQGTYNQIRLEISDVIVTDSDGERDAKLPSGELKVNVNFTVIGNSTSVAIFDFIVDESLHMTGNGEYILAPVLQIDTTEDAEVEIDSGKTVKVKGGRAKSRMKIGMGLNGTLGVDFEIPANANLSIGQDGVIKIAKSTNKTVSAKGSAKVNLG